MARKNGKDRLIIEAVNAAIEYHGDSCLLYKYDAADE